MTHITEKAVGWHIDALPALTGSERQIQWAERIRIKLARSINAKLDGAHHILLATDKPFTFPAREQFDRARARKILRGHDALNDLAGCDLRAMTQGDAIRALTLFARARWDWVLDIANASWWIDHRHQTAASIGIDAAGTIDPLAFFRDAMDTETPPPPRKVRLPLASIKGHIVSVDQRQRATIKIGVKDGRAYPCVDGWCRPDPIKVGWDGTMTGVPGVGTFFPERGELARLKISMEE